MNKTYGRYLLLLLIFWRFFTTFGEHKSQEDCLSNLRADLVFLVDASDGVDSFSYEFHVKDYLNDVVKKLPIGEDNVLISVVLYSDRLFLAIKPEVTNTLKDLLIAIRNLPHLGGTVKHVKLEQAIVQTLSGAFPPRLGAVKMTNATAYKGDNPRRMIVLMTKGHLKSVSSFDESFAHPLKVNTVEGHAGTLFGPFLRPTGSAGMESVRSELTKAEEARLMELGQKLSKQVDHVVSIGLPGAIEKGVWALASDPKHVLLLNSEKGYASLSTDEMDPSTIFCPLPVEKKCKQSASPRWNEKSFKAQPNQLKVTSWNGPPMMPGGGPLMPWCPPPPPPPPPMPFQPNQFPWYPGQSMPPWASEEEQRRTRRRLELLLKQLIRSLQSPKPSQENNKQFVPIIVIPQSQQPQQQPRQRQPVEQRRQPYPQQVQLPLSMIQQQIIQHQLPLQILTVNDNQPHGFAGHPLAYHIQSVKQVVADENYTETEPHVFDVLRNIHSNKDDVLAKAADSPQLGVSKSQPLFAHPMLVDYTTKINEYTTVKPTMTKTEARAAVERRNSILVPNLNSSFLTYSWQDSAMHRGGLLMFATKARSGLSFPQLYANSPKVTPQSGDWFKHPDFDQWTVGMYERVVLELRTNNQPVVWLTFNAIEADRFTWFQTPLLLEAHPWHERELVQQSVFLRSRDEPFSIIHKPSQSDRHAWNLTCTELRGYLLVVDAESPTAACSWLQSTSSLQNLPNYPRFLYGLPTYLWPHSGDVRAPKFDDKKAVREADELRVYTIPYSLARSRKPPYGAASYSLLFALDTQTGIAFRQLWHSSLTSSPAYQPIHREDETRIPPCMCWYRSRVLEHWHRPIAQSIRHLITTVSTGFKHTRLDLSTADGQVVARLVFDSRGAPADSWFTPRRLRSAWPWSWTELMQYNFVQFGRFTYWGQVSTRETTVAMINQSWSAIGLWIGRFQTDATQQGCESLLVVLDTEGGSRPLPTCLSIPRASSNSTMMAMNAQPSGIDNMQAVRQLTIWSE